MKKEIEPTEGGYRPGTPGEAEWLCAEFARGAAREVGDAASHASAAPAEPERSNLRYAAVVLAAYQVLRPRCERAEPLLDHLAAAFAASGAVFTPKVRAWLDASPDAFADMVAVSKLRERESFGGALRVRAPARRRRRLLRRRTTLLLARLLYQRGTPRAHTSDVRIRPQLVLGHRSRAARGALRAGDHARHRR
jgi:hypothetical protein